MTYFVLDETPFEKGRYLIRPNFDNENAAWTDLNGSWNILPARVLEISYPQYLKYCRDELGARVMSKGNRYPYLYFQKNDATCKFLAYLNEVARVKF